MVVLSCCCPHTLPPCGYCLKASMMGLAVGLSFLPAHPPRLWIADQVRNDGAGRTHPVDSPYAGMTGPAALWIGEVMGVWGVFEVVDKSLCVNSCG